VVHVVQRCQSERALPAHHALRRRGVVLLEKELVLDEIHGNEDETVRAMNRLILIMHARPYHVS